VRGQRSRSEDCIGSDERSRENVIVPQSQDREAAIGEVAIAALVVPAVRVLTAISLNHQTLLERNKIHDPRSYRHLTTKFHVSEAT
jgi:hypothetical protein